jgi:hypothetical protein
MNRTAVLMVLLVCSGKAGAAAAPARVDYATHLKPLLRERCWACHGALQQKGGLRLDTAALIKQGGDAGPVVVPGRIEDSPLLERIAGARGSRRMPPEGPPLTPEQVMLVRSWVLQGAAGPAGERREADPRDHWAFRKPVRPAVPAGDRPHPIDRFLARRWKQSRLSPAPAADKRTLARRLYLDLTGLPPTPREMSEYLGDDSPLAYERLVDRLLASPAYGERWGRHWMDVWRYSDWYGRRAVPDVLNSYAMIWRWRDWIVRSLNEDRPYDRMVQEMLAADELCPTERENLPATGFLVRNFFRWNYNQWMRDNVEHTGKAFLGLTMQCCQCHDHKYDPITQKEYFRFRAFFEPLEIRHERVPGEPDPGVFPKYSYGAAYKPITSGMVRVFDEKPDAQTYMYARGDERNRIPGKPPVKPGAPAFLGGDKLLIAPVSLPPEAAHPGLLPFVQEEETAARLEVVKTKRSALAPARARREALQVRSAELEAGMSPGRHAPLPLREAHSALQARLRLARASEAVLVAELTAAEAEWRSVRARIAADNARFGKAGGDKDALARAAARAEKGAALESARARLVQQEQNLIVYKADGPSALAGSTEKLIAPLRRAAEAARAAVDKAGAAYTPLGPAYPARSSGRRLALAKWITSPDNPLTARVAVNHVWCWHFGQPLVETTANFGRQGAPPTHPELLDWLAGELVSGGWRFKRLHRLIVTSSAYRMASTHPDPTGNRSLDPDNRLLWRYPPRRLEAEAVRDALLHAAGELDRTPGGREVAQDQGRAVGRRSLYFAHHGETRMVFLDLFDASNPSDCYRRAASVRPQQALAMTNSHLTARMARRLAGKLTAEFPADEAFVHAAFERVLARPAGPAELAASSRFLGRQQRLFRASPPPAVAGSVPGDAPSTDPVRRSRENLVLALFNHTDFVTLR